MKAAFDLPTSVPMPRGGARYVAAAAAFALAFMAIGAASVQLALSGEDAPREAQLAADAGAPPSPRADIVDRNGELLASTLTTHSLYADPSRVWDVEATAAAIAGALPELDAAEIADSLAQGAARERRFVWIKRGLSPRQRQAVFALGLGGLGFVEEPRRIYPRGRLAAHALGWTTIDGVGAAGAERAFDAELSAGDGRPLALSIDLRVQFALDDELRAAVAEFDAQAGVGLVTDVRTGEILALASLPDFDPNHAGEAEADARLNRAMASVYELGSIFKTFTVSAALESGAAEVGTLLPTDGPLEIGGAVVTDAAPAGRKLSVADAFIRSSNVGVGALGLSLGAETQQDFLARFGLLERAPVALAESAQPLLPARWNEAARATVSYGHGIAVSPAAFMAGFGAAVNGGNYVRPTLRPVGPRGAVEERVLSEETSREVAQLLRAAVLFGTGRRADAPGLGVGGKTGTAEKPAAGGYDPDRVIASFAAVFPYDSPRYAVLILLDEPHGTEETHGRAGAGYTAAPTAGAVIARIAPILGVPRADPEDALPARYEAWNGYGGSLEDGAQ
jgi:cell division protein FtsI (penicillin-binding protein 3)